MTSGVCRDKRRDKRRQLNAIFASVSENEARHAELASRMGDLEGALSGLRGDLDTLTQHLVSRLGLTPNWYVAADVVCR